MGMFIKNLYGYLLRVSVDVCWVYMDFIEEVVCTCIIIDCVDVNRYVRNSDEHKWVRSPSSASFSCVQG